MCTLTIQCVTHSVSSKWAWCNQIFVWLYLMPTIDCYYILSLVEGEGSGSSSEEGGEEEEEEEEKEGLEFLVSGKHLVEVRYSHLVYRLYDNRYTYTHQGVVLTTSAHSYHPSCYSQACQTEEGLSNVAAAAEQFQPKGITFATTEVQ